MGLENSLGFGVYFELNRSVSVTLEVKKEVFWVIFHMGRSPLCFLCGYLDGRTCTGVPRGGQPKKSQKADD